MRQENQWSILKNKAAAKGVSAARLDRWEEWREWLEGLWRRARKWKRLSMDQRTKLLADSNWLLSYVADGRVTMVKYGESADDAGDQDVARFANEIKQLLRDTRPWHSGDLKHPTK